MSTPNPYVDVDLLRELLAEELEIDGDRLKLTVLPVTGLPPEVYGSQRDEVAEWSPQAVLLEIDPDAEGSLHVVTPVSAYEGGPAAVARTVAPMIADFAKRAEQVRPDDVPSPFDAAE